VLVVAFALLRSGWATLLLRGLRTPSRSSLVRVADHEQVGGGRRFLCPVVITGSPWLTHGRIRHAWKNTTFLHDRLGCPGPDQTPASSLGSELLLRR
jgi:hypothetical protein